MFGASNLWGIDLGGTKVEGAILESAANPNVLFRIAYLPERIKVTTIF